MSTLKTTRSRSHIASVNIIPRIVDPTVVPTLDLDLGQPKPTPGPSPIMPFSSVYNSKSAITSRKATQPKHFPTKIYINSKSDFYSTSYQQLKLVQQPATYPKRTIHCVVCPLYLRPPLTINFYSGQTTQQIITLGKLQVVKLIKSLVRHKVTLQL